MSIKPLLPAAAAVAVAALALVGCTQNNRRPGRVLLIFCRAGRLRARFLRRFLGHPGSCRAVCHSSVDWRYGYLRTHHLRRVQPVPDDPRRRHEGHRQRLQQRD